MACPRPDATFSARTELVNGRTAMLGLLAALVQECPGRSLAHLMRVHSQA